LFDPIFIGFVDGGGAGQAAAALGAFSLEQMAFPRFGAENLATGGDFEPFGHGFLCFDAFWTSHKLFNYSLKKSA
jgi:hypothetical protein